MSRLRLEKKENLVINILQKLIKKSNPKANQTRSTTALKPRHLKVKEYQSNQNLLHHY